MPDDGERVFRVLEGAKGRSGRATDWLGLLEKGDKGYYPTVANALLILGNDERVAGMLGFDEFRDKPLLLAAPPPPQDTSPSLPGPYPRSWNAADTALVHAWLQRSWTGKFTAATTEAAMIAVASLRRFHPVRDWLAGLAWDGVPRLGTWLHHAFGCPKDAYHDAVGTKFLVAAVRRVRLPGCKFDAMPVLEGAQDQGKSRACRALFGEAWFSDSMPHDMGSRDAALSLLGVWGLELGELDGLIRSEVETVKAFLSRQVDHYRPPYGKDFVDRPRQGVLIGTTNQHDYLKDATGNRRFWPIRCTKAEADWIAEVREQLWAEAAALEAEGEPLWLEDSTIRDAARAQQIERLAEDVWADAIRDYLYSGPGGRLGKVRVSDLLQHALGLSRDKQTRGAEMRVASVLRAEKWTPKVEWVDGKTCRFWLPP